MWWSLPILLFLSSYLDQNDPFVIDCLRVSFIVVHLVSLLAYAIIWKRIKAANDRTSVRIVNSATSTTTTLPAVAYDSDQTHKGVQRVSLVLIIIVVVHLWKGFVVPLFIQSVVGFFSLLGDDLFKIYILGRSVRRPFAGHGLLDRLTDYLTRGRPETEVDA
eukprot:TRINITY_DN161_c0_g1_i16.p1 TRINITY_DN161_c0_g1~~TRINITY_DN161_c0_g1_i16.p1  ORF type:complete len:162 (+),score=3.25 TRINITY_DN161_c0_g1_i16:121-606(+)